MQQNSFLASKYLAEKMCSLAQELW
jgi:hypothetical protein